jgi:hypothetical protein
MFYFQQWSTVVPRKPPVAYQPLRVDWDKNRQIEYQSTGLLFPQRGAPPRMSRSHHFSNQVNLSPSARDERGTISTQYPARLARF